MPRVIPIIAVLLSFIGWSPPGKALPELSEFPELSAGMQLSELCTALKHSGFTLPSLPILLDQTVGGAIATGSHGSSGNHGTLSDQVVSTKMVLPSGEVVIVVEDGARIKPSDDGSKVVYNSSLLAAARCGVGRVGTNLDVTLQLIPTPTLQKREVELDMSGGGVAETIRTLVSSTEHCWIHWILDDGYIQNISYS